MIDKDKSRESIMNPIRSLSNISDIQIFDLYAGDKLPEGKKSVAFTFSIKGDGTMSSDQINEVIQEVVKTGESHGATLR